jgi:DNA-binding XRE family transcriptional regulator
MTNIGTKRSSTARALTQAKKAIRRADKKIRLDNSADVEGIEKIKAEAYKLETMISGIDHRCSLHKVFCDRVRARREKLKLTQAAIADKLGVVSTSYAAIEQGRASPSLDTITRVAEALDCRPLDLLK